MSRTPEGKPIPHIDPWTEPHWAAAKDGVLIIQRCRSCGRHVFYPRPVCPHCASDDLEWVEASGKATVYSFTVVENNAPSGFLADMPFVVAILDLEEGVRMMSNIVDCDPHSVYVDMPVQVGFRPLTDDVTLPVFRPADA